MQLFGPIRNSIVSREFVTYDFSRLAHQGRIEGGARTGALHELLPAREKAHHGIAFFLPGRNLIQLKDITDTFGPVLDTLAIFLDRFLKAVCSRSLFHFRQRLEEEFLDMQQFTHFIPKYLFQRFHSCGVERERTACAKRCHYERAIGAEVVSGEPLFYKTKWFQRQWFEPHDAFEVVPQKVVGTNIREEMTCQSGRKRSAFRACQYLQVWALYGFKQIFN